MLHRVLSLTIAMVLASSAMGQSRKLAVGDKAPGLDIDKWVTGKETTIEPGQVYVVEFWATWCAPCRKSMPHLDALQKQYADDGLTIIGISDEERSKVEQFAKSPAGRVSYTLAVDRNQSTKRAWFDAAGLKGIPAAFVVDREGKIVYIGHPMSPEFEQILPKVLSGRYDPKLTKAAEPTIRAAENARKMRNWRMAMRHYDEVINQKPELFVNVALDKFEMLLLDMDSPKEAYQFVRRDFMSRLYANDAEAMQMLAQKIATDPKIDQSKRDMDLALHLVTTALRLEGQNNAKALAAVASIKYHRGELQEAIELQKQAYFNARPQAKQEFRRTLMVYQDAAERAVSMNIER